MKDNKYKLSQRTQERLGRALTYQQKISFLNEPKIDVTLSQNSSSSEAGGDVLHGVVTQSVISELYNKCIIATCLGYPASLTPDQMRAVILGVQAMQLKPYIFTEAMNEASEKEFEKNHMACIASVIPTDNVQPITEMRKNEEWRKLYCMLQYSLTDFSKSPPVLLDSNSHLLQFEDWQRIAVSQELAQISQTLELKEEQKKKLEEFISEMKKTETPYILEVKKKKLKKIREILSTRLAEEAGLFLTSHNDEQNQQNMQESMRHFAEVAIDVVFWMTKSDDSKNNNDKSQDTKVILMGMHKQPKFVTRVRQQANYLFGRDSNSIDYIDIKLERDENALDDVENDDVENDDVENDDVENDDVEENNAETQNNQTSISEEELERNRQKVEVNKLFIPLSMKLANEGKLSQIVELMNILAEQRAKQKPTLNVQFPKNRSTLLGTSPPSFNPLPVLSTSPQSSSSMEQFGTTQLPTGSQTTKPSFYRSPHTTFSSRANTGNLGMRQPVPVGTVHLSELTSQMNNNTRK
jgi:hypothetical protein